MSPSGPRRPVAGKTQTTCVEIEAWAGTAAPWKRCVKPGNTSANGAESRRWAAVLFRLLPGLQLGDDLVVTLDLLLLGGGESVPVLVGVQVAVVVVVVPIRFRSRGL